MCAHVNFSVGLCGIPESHFVAQGVHSCHSVCVCKSLDVSLCMSLGVSTCVGLPVSGVCLRVSVDWLASVSMSESGRNLCGCVY